MLTSGKFYLQYFDSQNNRFVESNDDFSFSTFFNPPELTIKDGFLPVANTPTPVNPTTAIQNNLITSGQAVSAGMTVTSSGTGPNTVVTILHGPKYIIPMTATNSLSIPTNPSSYTTVINGIHYIKVYVGGIVGTTSKITGYWWGINLNP